MNIYFRIFSTSKRNAMIYNLSFIHMERFRIVLNYTGKEINYENSWMVLEYTGYNLRVVSYR